MGFYARMQATANKLLKGKGQAVTITHTTQGSYDPATGAITNTSSTQSGYGATFEYSTQAVDGTLIVAGDKKLLLSALNAAGTILTAPSIGDTLSIGGTITSVKPLSPAGTTVLYECNLG